MKHKIEFDEKCKSCKGTGLYSGMGESPECAIVCSTCKGTGCHHFEYEYEDFIERQNDYKIKWVYEVNPGIKVGNGNGFDFKDFGGMSYDEWLKGNKFKRGMENRQYTCPAWWYQSADYKQKPNWEECIGIGSFSSCKNYVNKQACWEKFDRIANKSLNTD